MAAVSRPSRVAARWSDGGGPLVLLLVAGMLFAAGDHTLTQSVSSDVALYQHYASAALASPVLHAFPREYPAAALAAFLPAEAVPAHYALGFAVLAAFAAVLLVLSSDGLEGHPGWSHRVCVYMLAGTVVVVFARYDIFPALGAFLAVEGARRGRWGRAWAWAVLGGVLKLFPFLLLPGFVLVERAHTGKWPVRRALAAGGAVGLLVLGQLVVAPASLLSPFSYEMGRGFELSSLPGSFTLLVDPLHVEWGMAFGSTEVVGGFHAVIAAVATLAMVLGLIVVWVLANKRRLPVEVVSLAVLSMVVLTNKAFAAQYLVWLVPFWAYWPMRRGWVTAAALTTLVYPLLYEEARIWGPGFYLATAVAALRNLVLVVATVLWLAEQLRREGDRPTERSPDFETGPVQIAERPSVVAG